MSRAGLLRAEIVPFLGALGMLAAATLLVDAALHLMNVVWVGRYLGIVGTSLILLSFGYSARKRKWITSGKPVTLLRIHEWLSWAGALLVLVHAGVHFESLLAWFAVLAMVVNVASGLTGKYLLARSRQHMDAARSALRVQGVDPEVADERLFWDAAAFDAIKQWRTAHFPITVVFGALGAGHIVASVVFWSAT
ncbi:MAG: hypothetical protein ABMA64_17715 [Myxococcota bacterium]